MQKEAFDQIKQKLSMRNLLVTSGVLVVAFGLGRALTSKTEYLDITMRLDDQTAVVESSVVGKTQKGPLGAKLAEITAVDSYSGDYTKHQTLVTMHLRTTFNKITKQNFYQDRPILLNGQSKFSIEDLALSGTVVGINDKENTLNKVNLSVVLQSNGPVADIHNNDMTESRGIENYLADAVQNGLSIKDSKNREIVKITNAEKIPGQVILATTGGLKEVTDPSRTQVRLDAEIQANKVGETYFLGEQALVVGQTIHLNFANVTVNGKIVRVN